MKHLFVFTAITVWLIAAVYSDDDVENIQFVTEKVREGIESGQEILKIMEENNWSQTFYRIGKIGTKLAPFLGAFAPAISLITLFLPKSESEELKLMKKEFAEIDANFDKVFNQFGEIKNMIEKKSMQAQYSQYEHTILSLSEKLQEYLNASQSNMDIYRRMFIKEYEDSCLNGATGHLFRAMTEKTVLASNIPNAAMSYTDYHRRRTQSIMKGVLNLILQGIKVELAYYAALEIKSSDVGYNVTQNEWTIIIKAKQNSWEKKIKDLLSHMESVDTKVKGMWKSQAKKDIEKKLLDLKEISNKDFANISYTFLKDKYDWKNWHVVVYKEMEGDDKHYTKVCNGFKFTNKHGRNVVVASVDQSYVFFGEAERLLKEQTTPTAWAARIECTYKVDFLPFLGKNCDDLGAKYIFDHLDPSLTHGCNYPSVGVIKINSDEDVQHEAPGDGRLVRLETYLKAFQLYAFT